MRVPGSRLRALRRLVASRGEPAFLATGPVSVRYLAGARDAGWALVTSRHAVLAPSALGLEAARRETGTGWEVLKPAPGMLSRTLSRLGVRRLGFESDSVPAAEAARLRASLRDAAVLVPLPGLVAACREIKDPPEIAAIRRAGWISAQAGGQFPWFLRDGITEAEAAALLDIRMRALGAEGPAFETIVLFGDRTALPHGVPGARRLSPGDMILADFGARVDDYASDTTRTWAWRKSSARQRRTYRAVARAYMAGRAALKPGASCGAVDAAARRALGGLRKAFMHSLGHGIGLEIHEAPRLGGREKTRIRPGMAVTVEPGVYFGRWGGIRLEDSFVVGPRAAESVTGAPAPELPVAGPV